MTPSTINISRTLAVFAAVVTVARLLAPSLISTKSWSLAGNTSVTAMLVFLVYTVAYMVIGIGYIARKRAHDRHIFPEGVTLEGRLAVKLGLKYLILSSISLFGATLIYAVILRGNQFAYLQPPL